MANGSYFWFDGDDMIKYTYSHKHHKKVDWEDWRNLRHTLDRMYLTSILEVQYFQIHLHKYDSELV